MTNSRHQVQQTPAKTMGRPRRLSLSAVIEAAAELGLENVSMSAVAARLSVGVTTIYTYVRSRDELLQLVATRLAWRPRVEDTGQHWAEIVRAHAGNIFALFSTNPELLAQLISGAVGPEDEMEEVEAFLQLLCARGFSAEESFNLFRSVTQLSFGAALGATMTARSGARGSRRLVNIACAMAERGAEELPMLRSLGDIYMGEESLSSYDYGLDLLLEQTAMRRGETLPENNVAARKIKP
jgi:AcrR family transcriptional regulator